MADAAPTKRTYTKTTGTAGTTGTGQCLQGLTWSRLRQSDWDHWVLNTENEAEDRQAVPVVPGGKYESGPDNSLILMAGPSGPSGPSREIAGPNEILNLLRLAQTVAEVETIMAEYSEAIEAINALPDELEAVRAIHIRNLARYRNLTASGGDR